MTKDKDFKRLVRRRMAETGESYTAARDQLDNDVWRQSGRRAWRASEALDKAVSLKHHWAGEEHVLLALLENGSESRAARALAAAGVTYEGVTAALAARLERFGPPVPRKYRGTLSHPSFHSVRGRAEGFALGVGGATPEMEHALLGLLWQVDGTADRLFGDLGTSRQDVFAHLVDEGAVVPIAPPEAPAENVLLVAAGRQAAMLDDAFIGQDHLVLALLDGDPDDVAGRALRTCGVSLALVEGVRPGAADEGESDRDAERPQRRAAQSDGTWARGPG